MPELMPVYALFGVGFCASGLLPATTLVARWFETSRAKALSLASSGPLVMGVIYSKTGFYQVSYTPAAALGFVSILLYLVSRPPLA